MDPVTMAILIASIITSIGGTAATMYGQRTANQTNIQLAREGQEFERQQVERMNTYNSPLNQMERLGQAGLNPRLIYNGKQGGVTGNQTTTPRAHVPTVQNTLQTAMKTDPLGTLMQYQKLRIDTQKEQNMITDKALQDAKKVTEIAKQRGINLDNAPKEVQRDIIQYLHTGWDKTFTPNNKVSTSPFTKEWLRKQNIDKTKLNILSNDLKKSNIDITAWQNLNKMGLNDPNLKAINIIGNMITDAIPSKVFKGGTKPMPTKSPKFNKSQYKPKQIF